MNDTLKRHVISAARVFVSAFIVSLAGSIAAAGSITWTKEFIIPLCIAAVSAAIKSVMPR